MRTRTDRFGGKVVIVTGATSGIGRTVATQLAAEGARVVAAGRRRFEGEELVREIREAGGEAHFLETDVRNSASVEAMVRETVARYGRLDCAFNNAGIGGENRLLAEQTEAGWDEVISTNLRGIWLCMKHAITAMLASGGGSIVNNASIFGAVGAAYGIAPYIASKHGVLGLMRAAAVEYADRNIRVNAVCPGITHTEMTGRALKSAPKEVEEQIRINVPMNRLGQPSEIARAVLWLCSDEASFVTGQALSVDGGWLAR